MKFKVFFLVLFFLIALNCGKNEHSGYNKEITKEFVISSSAIPNYADSNLDNYFYDVTAVRISNRPVNDISGKCVRNYVYANRSKYLSILVNYEKVYNGIKFKEQLINKADISNKSGFHSQYRDSYFTGFI